MSKDNGGPEFPPNAGWRDDDPQCRGMTLRDYFAAKAIPAATEWEHASPTYNGATYKAIAERAYLLADAMLAERAK